MNAEEVQVQEPPRGMLTVTETDLALALIASGFTPMPGNEMTVVMFGTPDAPKAKASFNFMPQEVDYPYPANVKVNLDCIIKRWGDEKYLDENLEDPLRTLKDFVKARHFVIGQIKRFVEYGKYFVPFVAGNKYTLKMPTRSADGTLVVPVLEGGTR